MLEFVTGHGIIKDSLINSGTRDMDINSDQAYIAIRSDGFVEAAYFTESADSKSWVAEMKSQDFIVEIRNRAESKRLLFTTIQ